MSKLQSRASCPDNHRAGVTVKFRVHRHHSGRQDAALYGSQDGCHYRRMPTLQPASCRQGKPGVAGISLTEWSNAAKP